MFINRDSAKEDLGLMIISAVALLLFVIIYSNYHPLSTADKSLGENSATQISAELLQEFGYAADSGPNTTYRVNSTLLDSLQKSTSIAEFYSESENRLQYPGFYWNSVFNIDRSEETGPFGFNELQSRNISIKLSEEGNLLTFENEHHLLPVQTIQFEALEYALNNKEISNLQFPEDDLIYENFQFQFVGLNSEQSDTIEVDPLTYNFFDRDVAERIADFYLDKSSWNRENFQLSQIEKIPFGDVEGARVLYESNPESAFIQNEIELVVLPTGTLGWLDYNYVYRTNDGLNLDQVIPAVRFIFITLGIFYVIILLFMRFRQRQIDLKAAILVAVLAGLIIPLTVISGSFYTHLQNFGLTGYSFIIGQLIGFGMIAAFSSLGFFIITAVSDSITRQNWPEKIKTIDFLRSGYFFSQPFGLVLVRGILFGFILLAVWSVMMAFIPGSYISLESSFFGDRYFFPNVAILFSRLALYLLISLAIFLILCGQLKSTVKTPALTVLATGLIFGLFNPMILEAGPISIQFITVGVIGLGAGFIYLKEDFLTVFISLSVFGLVDLSTAGWLLPQSSDAIIFYSITILIVVGFVYGGYSILKGRRVRDLPTFIPDYMDELAHEQRIRQELQIARKVQQSFLPDRTPDIEGLDIAAICKPAYETGGDYYDFITLEDGRLAVTVGDVSGKGIQAAFYMTFIKGVLHALCNEFVSSLDILSKTNKLFRKNAERGTFISLIFGIVDHDKNSFCFSRAGHNPLLYFNSKKGKLYEYQPDGIAVGMAEDYTFCKYISEQTIQLQKEDIIVLFTDGVVEATSRTDKAYGDKRLHSLIRKYNKLPAEELINKVYEDLKAFSDTTSQHDDLTMLIIKKK